MILKKAIFLLLFTFLTFTSCKKNEVSNVDSNLYFPQVKAIIQAKCLSCHSLVTGTGQGRPVIFDSDAQIADVYAASIKTSVETKRMPLEDTLSQTNIDLVVKWYKKGGKLTD
jgi:uncharacterized membrane protein